MREVADRLEHPALEGREGVAIDESPLTDRQRIAVVLQAAGLLSLCEVAGWRPASDWASARVDADGLLVGIEVEAGPLGSGGPARLAALLRTLFRTRDGIAGRGEARRAARALLARWDAILGPGSADRAVSDILEQAPFLTGEPFAAARRALAGTILRGDAKVAWEAGRSARAAPSSGRSLAELLAAGRFRAVVAAATQRDGLDAADLHRFAYALFAEGKAEAALAALGGRRDPAAELLRAKCQAQLGELGAAREAIRRLEAAELGVDDLLDGGDVALRVLANSGELDAARDWVARATRLARGKRRAQALLLAALAAIDRRDAVRARRFFARATATDPEGARWLSDEVEIQLALGRQDGAGAVVIAGRALRARRRRMPRVAAGRLWNNVGLARTLVGDFAGAERAYSHAARILRRCDGPLALTLAGCNLADVRLRLGSLREVDHILEESAAWNRRSGNLRGAAEDELLAVRRDLVMGALERAADRARRERERQVEGGYSWARGRLAVLEARALAWLERPAEARERLSGLDAEALGELEPEELPCLLALAGETDRALESAVSNVARGLVTKLVRDEVPSSEDWKSLDVLEPYRRARLVLDAELLAPGSVPRDRRREAAALFLRLGAAWPASICERGESVAWQALRAFFERPAADRGAIEELLAAVGHPESELVVRGEDGEQRLAGGGGKRLAAERSAAWGEGELVLRAGEIDEPLRALFAIFRHELRPRIPEQEAPASSLLGESAILAASLDRLRRFAASDLPVLILGENGTGKELAAREIHRTSARRRGPWVPVNCAGLSETLLLSELFGHVRGAFTGADQTRAGVFESARGGTVFLDEIGDLPLAAQGSLLRVLQEKEIRRLGESLPRQVDARVVAATNRDLEAMVEQGSFRQDLYFRLKVATVSLPPLRERGKDVLLLTDRFLAAIRERGRDVRLTPDGRRALESHSWPGNVRELRNVLEAAAALADDRLLPEHLDLATTTPSRVEGDYHHLIEGYRRRLIERALEASEGSLAGAARALGVTRQFLSQYVRKYGLKVG